MSQFGAQPIWKKGEALTAKKLNEVNARGIQQIRGTGIGVTRLNGDVSLIVPPVPYKAPVVRAIVTEYPNIDEGDNPYVCGVTPWGGYVGGGTPQYLGPQVYCKVYVAQSASDVDFSQPPEILMTQPYGGVTVDNYGAGDVGVLDPNGQPVTWEQISSPWELVIVSIAATDTNPGTYTGTASRASVNATAPNVPYFPCKITNISETVVGGLSYGGWALTPGTYNGYAQPATYLGRVVDLNSSGEIVVEIQGIPGCENYHTLSTSASETVRMQGGISTGIQSQGVQFTAITGISIDFTAKTFLVNTATVSIDTMGVVRVVEGTYNGA